MPTAVSIPDEFRVNGKLGGRLKVGVAEALTARFEEADWKTFAALNGLSEQLNRHPRFYRGLSWSNPDFKGLVLDLVSDLFVSDKDAFVALFVHEYVQAWLLENGFGDLIEIWDGAGDPLVTALAHGMTELRASRDVVDLAAYAARIENSLPSDPRGALGATKDMLEATMRSILRKRGQAGFEKYDFPKLTGQCFTLLGMAPNTTPPTQRDAYLRKMASSARAMIESANELRNLAGTGHGRVVGEEIEVSAEDAGLVASSGLVLAAWLLRRHETAP